MDQENTGPFSEPTGDISGIDADALLSQVESGATNQEIPMSQAEQPAQAPAAEKTQSQQAAELAFKWNNRDIKVPVTDPRLTQWASQGYDYAQRMAEFNKQQAEFAKQAELISQKEQRYSPVEQYIEQNPEWWNYVNAQYQQAQKGLGTEVDPNNPLVQKVETFGQDLSQIKQFIESKKAEEKAYQQAQQDQALEAEIKSIRDSYADLDWTNPNESGHTLEMQVLAHARENGISNFKAAFRDMMHEKLMMRAEEKAKENAVKERQKQTKLGLLGKTPAPKKGLTSAVDYKNRSYDDLFKEGAEEYGVSLG